MEYVSEKPDFGDANGFMNPLMQDFQRIFEKFAPPELLLLESTKVPILFLEMFVCASLPMLSHYFYLIRTGDVLSIEDIA